MFVPSDVVSRSATADYIVCPVSTESFHCYVSPCCVSRDLARMAGSAFSDVCKTAARSSTCSIKA